MKTTLAILAHESARPTVDDFLPRWKSLGIPLIAYVPVGDKLQGIDDCREIGESAHRGYKVFRRFLDTLNNLLEHDNADRFIVQEYDTVNLTPELPHFWPDCITSNVVAAPPHNCGGPLTQTCALSPWLFPTKDILCKFIEAGEASLVDNKEHEEVAGLLDRWIGCTCRERGVNLQMGFDMCGWPWHPGAHEKIARTRINWIHGWKRKEDFGYLWT